MENVKYFLFLGHSARCVSGPATLCCALIAFVNSHKLCSVQHLARHQTAQVARMRSPCAFRSITHLQQCRLEGRIVFPHANSPPPVDKTTPSMTQHWLYRCEGVTALLQMFVLLFLPLRPWRLIPTAWNLRSHSESFVCSRQLMGEKWDRSTNWADSAEKWVKY